MVETEVVDVLVQGAFIVQSEEPIFEGALDGRFPGSGQQSRGFVGVQPRLCNRAGQLIEVTFGVIDSEGGESGVQHEAVGRCPGPAQLGGGFGVGGNGVQGQAVSELPQPDLFGLGDYPVGHGA